jgi:hypothetical protein
MSPPSITLPSPTHAPVNGFTSNFAHVFGDKFMTEHGSYVGVETESKSNHWHFSVHTTLFYRSRLWTGWKQKKKNTHTHTHTHTHTNNFTNKWDGAQKKKRSKLQNIREPFYETL